MHRRTKLTPYHREEIWRLYHQEKMMVTDLAKRFMVSRPTIYVVLRRARLQLFVPMASTNERYKTIKYGIKRLAKIEKTLEDKLRRQANGKAERVIRTLMEMWHEKEVFINAQDRKLKLKRFINYYNTVKPHKGIAGKTPYEVLDHYFKPNL